MAVQSRLPEWFKVRMPGGADYVQLRNLLRDAELHTVCEEAHCPNIGECWERQTASFMILGNVCTWRCHYCAVKTGRPGPVDPDEPAHLAETVHQLGLQYCVITSVTRDDLDDSGASVFAACIRAIHDAQPACKVEVLIPDLRGDDALRAVLDADPDVLNHNIETVERVFHRVRPKGDYRSSLRLLARAREMAPHIPTKSGMMVGLGETKEEVHATMQDLRGAGCRLLTIGQYLRPSRVHFPLQRFYRPEEFDALSRTGEGLGFAHVASGPLVRSSYLADEQAAAVKVLGV